MQALYEGWGSDKRLFPVRGQATGKHGALLVTEDEPDES